MTTESGAGVLNRVLYAIMRVLVGDCIVRPYFRVRVAGLEHLPASGPVILVPNHNSLLDPIVLQSALRRRIIFMMTDTWFRRPLLHPFWVLARAISVRDEGSNRRALEQAARALARGWAIGIFPEGRISRDGALQRFHSGAAVLAIRERATVVPVHIDGSRAALKKGARVPRPARITIVLGEPLLPPVAPEAAGERRVVAAAFTERIRAAVAALAPAPTRARENVNQSD